MGGGDKQVGETKNKLSWLLIPWPIPYELCGLFVNMLMLICIANYNVFSTLSCSINGIVFSAVCCISYCTVICAVCCIGRSTVF